MLNWQPEDAEMYEDVQTRWQYEHTKGKPEKRLEKMWRCSRDSARTPMQWDATQNAGFSEAQPWFQVNSNYPYINAAQQEKDPDSILHFYRSAVELRKQLSAVQDGDYKEYYSNSEELYMYTRQDHRQRILVVCSFSEKPVKFKAPRDYHLEDGELVLQNYTNTYDGILLPYECRVYLWR